MMDFIDALRAGFLTAAGGVCDNQKKANNARAYRNRLCSWDQYQLSVIDCLHTVHALTKLRLVT